MADDGYKKNDQVGLFLRAMVSREPGKRKVKPSKAALIDLADLDLGESSDDSDFHVDEAKLREDDDISINSDPDDHDDDDGSSGSDNDDKKNENDIADKEKSNEPLSLNELLDKAKEAKLNAPDKGPTPKIMVCSVCLGDYSDDTNEIVSCDGCHVAVHEGCYGISDTISESSTVSSCSTEPWFCDACKAGVTNPPCELCPNLGYSIFKETEMGRWVHLVCALYVPGVAFSEVENLSYPTLFECAYSRWGSKTCTLCEDIRYSKTGIGIGCDAGMCKANFHVTCAQREGLLSEVNQHEADQADPYYAHCKMHTDKELIRRRKRNFLTCQVNMRAGIAEETDIKTEERLDRKKMIYREKYLFQKASRPTPWYPTQKLPRPLTTCASLFRSLLRKTEVMGIKTDTPHLNDNESMGDIRKKWHIGPAFNNEYVSYYLDRINRIEEMKQNLKSHLTESEQLTLEETRLRNAYNSFDDQNTAARIKTQELLTKCLELHDMLKFFAGRPLKLAPVVAALHNPPVFDEISPASTGRVGSGAKDKRLITKAAAKMIGEGTSRIAAQQNNSTPSTSKASITIPLTSPPFLPSVDQPSQNGVALRPSSSSGLTIASCNVCRGSLDQHFLIQCDTCSFYYHLACLDPPLTRMPKKTKQMGWQCSDCCKSSESDEPLPVDTGGPRRLRRLIKEPAKFSPSQQNKSGQKVPRSTDTTPTTPTPSKFIPPVTPEMTTPITLVSSSLRKEIQENGITIGFESLPQPLNSKEIIEKMEEDVKEKTVVEVHSVKSPLAAKRKLEMDVEEAKVEIISPVPVPVAKKIKKRKHRKVRGWEKKKPKKKPSPQKQPDTKKEEVVDRKEEEPIKADKTKPVEEELKKNKAEQVSIEEIDATVDTKVETKVENEKTDLMKARNLKTPIKRGAKRRSSQMADVKAEKHSDKKAKKEEIEEEKKTEDVVMKESSSTEPAEDPALPSAPTNGIKSSKTKVSRKKGRFSIEGSVEGKQIPAALSNKHEEGTKQDKKQEESEYQSNKTKSDNKNKDETIEVPLLKDDNDLLTVGEPGPAKSPRGRPRRGLKSPQQLPKEDQISQKPGKDEDSAMAVQRRRRSSKTDTTIKVKENSTTKSIIETMVEENTSIESDLKSKTGANQDKKSKSTAIVAESKSADTVDSKEPVEKIGGLAKPYISEKPSPSTRAKRLSREIPTKPENLESSPPAIRPKKLNLDKVKNKSTSKEEDKADLVEDAKNLVAETLKPEKEPKVLRGRNRSPNCYVDVINESKLSEDDFKNKENDTKLKDLETKRKENDVAPPKTKEIKSKENAIASLKTKETKSKENEIGSPKTKETKPKENEMALPKTKETKSKGNKSSDKKNKVKAKLDQVESIKEDLCANSPEVPASTMEQNETYVNILNSSNEKISLDFDVKMTPPALCLSSPTSDSPLSHPDSPKEKRKRDNSKKKKKDKDRERERDGLDGKKRKKHHHRDKGDKHAESLLVDWGNSMASEMVTPFRLKIKPLPPRPTEEYDFSEDPVQVATSKPLVTPTTTAPPGYPPLPPGYTLTHPMLQDAPEPSFVQSSSPSTNSSNGNIYSNAALHHCLAVSSGSTMAVSGAISRPGAPRKKGSDVGCAEFSKCDVCKEMGGVTNTVTCDGCKKAYHFNCLEPPLKKSPKRRGYSWFCEDCEPKSTTNNN